MFHKKFPDIRIRINNSTTPAAMNALKSGSVDFSVVTSPVEYDDEFEIVNIKNFQRCTRLRKRNGFFERKIIGIGELKEHPLISLSKGSSTYDFYSKNIWPKNGTEIRSRY